MRCKMTTEAAADVWLKKGADIIGSSRKLFDT